MSGWIKFAAATVLGVAVVGCGANGGDPVAGQQIPAAPADSPQPSGSSDSGSAAGGSGGGGGGSGSGDRGGRKVGLPESLRISEVGQPEFEDSVVAACGSKNGAPGCLTVTYRPGDDPDDCSFGWVSDPPKSSTSENNVSAVKRDSSIFVTICPQPDDTMSPAPEDTSPAPDDSMSPADEQMSTSDSPTASP